MATKSVKKDALTGLGLVTDDQLEEILTDLDLTVSVERRKKENAVFNLIFLSVISSGYAHELDY